MSEPRKTRLKRDLFRAVKKKLSVDKVSRDASDEEITVIVDILLKHTYRITDSSNTFDTHYRLGGLINSGVYGMVHQCSPMEEEKREERVTKRPLVCKIMNKSTTFGIASEGHITLPELLLRIRNVRSEVAILKGVCMKKDRPSQEQESEMKRHRKDNRARRRLCRVYGVFESDSQILIVMEEMVGGELFSRLRRDARIDEFAAADIAKQICQALQYLHQTCKVMHCDLKPANIMFADFEERRVKLIDFGFSKQFDSDGEEYSSVPCGSPHYTAPEAVNLRVPRSVFDAKFKRRKPTKLAKEEPLSEMVELSPHYSYPSDMWSVGCIVYTMVFGFPPFMNANLPPGMADTRTNAELNSEIYLKVLKGFYPEVMDVRKYGYGAWFPNNIPVSQECRDFISGLLVRNHRTRMTAAEALKHPWLVATHKLSKIPGIATMQDLKLISLVPEPPVLASMVDIGNCSDTSSSSCGSSSGSSARSRGGSSESNGSLMMWDDGTVESEDGADHRTE